MNFFGEHITPFHYFGGLCINNTLVYRAGAGEEIFCRWGAKGTHVTQDSCSHVLGLKGPVQYYQSSVVRGGIFISHK